MVKRYQAQYLDDINIEDTTDVIKASDYDALAAKADAAEARIATLEAELAKSQAEGANPKDKQRIAELEDAIQIIRNLICGPRAGTPEYSAMLHIERVMRGTRHGWYV